MIDQSFGHYHMSLEHYEKLKKADIKINDMYFPTENSNKNLSNNIITTIKNKHFATTTSGGECLVAAITGWWQCSSNCSATSNTEHRHQMMGMAMAMMMTAMTMKELKRRHQRLLQFAAPTIIINIIWFNYHIWQF